MSLVEHRHAPSLFRAERREYRLIYAFSFPLFLAMALISRLVPASVRPIPFERGHFFKVVADARETAHSVLPHAFMR